MINDDALAFLQRLVETPSPSGFEGANAAHFREYVAPFADTVTTDRMGNVIASVNPQGSPRVMLAGHIDEIGFLVHYIADDGFVYVRGVGGHDNAVIVGQRVAIQTDNGPVKGVIGKKPIHVLTAEERGKPIELYDLWVDVGVTGGRDEVLAAGVKVGDCVTYDVGMTHLLGDRITARGLDNRIGAWVVAEALRRVKELHPQAAVFAVATVQEEIGIRGAISSTYGVEPQIGIAVDVTFSTDYPSMDKRRFSDLKIGAGPGILFGANANRKLTNKLVSVAAEQSLPWQAEATPGATGTDAAPMQISRGSVTTGLVSIPLRYMHTPCEIISLADADNAATLIAHACAAFRAEDDWTP